MIFVKFEDNHKNLSLFNIWKKSFDELNENIRVLFTNYMRIYLNRITLSKANNYREYELERFEVRNKTDQVIVEERCSFCLNFQYVSVNVNSYLSFF